MRYDGRGGVVLARLSRLDPETAEKFVSLDQLDVFEGWYAVLLDAPMRVKQHPADVGVVKQPTALLLRRHITPEEDP